MSISAKRDPATRSTGFYSAFMWLPAIKSLHELSAYEKFVKVREGFINSITMLIPSHSDYKKYFEYIIRPIIKVCFNIKPGTQTRT